jgi:hypothetical protein
LLQDGKDSKDMEGFWNEAAEFLQKDGSHVQFVNVDAIAATRLSDRYNLESERKPQIKVSNDNGFQHARILSTRTILTMHHSFFAKGGKTRVLTTTLSHGTTKRPQTPWFSLCEVNSNLCVMYLKIWTMPKLS